MAAYVASDDDLFVLRRFQRLGARVALMMQDRIAKLEEDLFQEDNLGRIEKSHNGTFRHEQRQRRQELMDEIEWRLSRYRMPCSPIQVQIFRAEMYLERFILDHSELKARPDANKFQIDNIKSWLENSNGPITQAEVKFINKEGDLMPLVPKVKSPLRRVLDRYNVFRRIPCFRESKVRTSFPGTLSSGETGSSALVGPPTLWSRRR